MNSAENYPGEVFAETADFDSGIRALIPHYDEMLHAIVKAVPADARQILELGCGTGELTVKILQRCPSAHVYTVDYSSRMLQFAQHKMERLGFAERVSWIEADFGNWAEHGSIQEIQAIEVPLDACISSLAIHHLSDELKLKLFQQLHYSLRQGGCFWNADPVLSASEALTAVYEEARAGWLQKQPITPEEIRAKMNRGTSHGYSSHDHLATLAMNLDFLSKALFSPVDVLWKYYGFAVFGGYKS
jgi:trans-aconitate 2-methyltransferase